MGKIRKIILVIALVVVLSTSAFAYDGEDIDIDIDDNSENFTDSFDYISDFILENFKNEIIEKKITKEDLVNAAYKGMFEALDEHSVYFTEKEYDDFIVSASGEFGGIGISVTKKGKYITVIAPLQGTPGDKAGFKSGDKIIKVDDEDMTDWTLDKAVSFMRGEAGTSVKLTIDRNGEIIDKEIIREIIEINSVEYKVLDNNIGYLKIIKFGSNSYIETKEALFNLKSENIESLIIDLRNNPGGYLDEVVYIADLFIDEGKNIVNIDYETEEDVTYVAEKPDLFDKEIIVLVNGGSASASEILTGALKDNDEATIIGTTTYGKGTVQTLVKLKNGAGMKVTVAEYMTANKTHINKVGIEPDIIIENKLPTDINKAEENFVPTNEKRNIYYGETSLNVYGVQQRLSALGYELINDASFGPITLNAINKFQDENNIKKTKYIDNNLIKAIDNVVEINETKEVDFQLQEAIKNLTTK